MRDNKATALLKAAGLLKAAEVVKAEALLTAADLVKTSTQLIDRLARVETKVEGLILYQKVQIGALTAILASIIGAWKAR